VLVTQAYREAAIRRIVIQSQNRQGVLFDPISKRKKTHYHIKGQVDWLKV
jgi:hypothetical protein